VLVTYEGFLSAVTKICASGEDLKHPLVSSGYGGFANFPPPNLVAGTRDMLLSDVACTRLKLREAGVTVSLHVYDGMSHAGYLLIPDSPEGLNVFNARKSFVDVYLDE
jgi:acetyl esterase/lipase